MALIDKASLLMVPSTYEDGTLYNILPSGNKAPDETGNHNGYDQTRADFTFSRGSNLAATRINSSGLIEKGRENVMTHSNGFDNWTNDDSTETSGQEGYDGTNDAWKLVGNTNASRHHLLRSVSFSGVGTYSLYAKASGHNYVQIASAQNTGEYANFDLSDGSVGNVGNKFIDAKATSVGNGWYRLSVVTTSGANAMYISLVSSKTAAWLESWTMDNATDGILIQDAQLESGLVSTPYIATGATTAQAGILEDMPRIDYSSGAGALLLEPLRTNLIANSEYITGFSTSNTGVSVEENATTSPEGVVNAAKIKEDGTNAAHAVRQLTGPTLTSGTDYTFSFFAKKGERTIVALSNTIGASNDANCFFDLENGQVLTNTFNSASIEDFGNGWYRCIATDTADAADDYDTRIYTATADNQFTHQGVSGSGLYIFGIQLEAGSYVSSYIPTMGTAASRAADSCSVTGVSDVIDSTQGTIYFEGYSANTSVTNYSYFISLSDGTQNNRLELRQSGDEIQFLWRVGGVYQNNIITSGASITDKWKAAVKYSSSEISFYLNGSEVGNISSPTLYSANTLNRFGFDDGADSNKLQGKNEQLVYFNEALSDSELATLTTL